MENKGTDMTTPAPAETSCWKKAKSENAVTFKDHVEAFVKSPMKEHKECFKNAINRMVEKAKKAPVCRQTGTQSTGVESSSSLQTTTTLSK